jgi:N-acetylglutamate synthase-like GNAT family acetyltransferase
MRQEVLYPTKTFQSMIMDEDFTGLHFGAFYDGQLVSVVSLSQQENDFQFRKFAVLPSMQHKGVGRQLLQYITNFASAQGGKRIWCNARLSAVAFYYKSGFATTGDKFVKDCIEYEIMEKKLV